MEEVRRDSGLVHSEYGRKLLRKATEIERKRKETGRKRRQRRKTCVKTLKCSAKLRMTYETENQGDIQLRTTKHASPYYMYCFGKVLRVGKITSK